MYAELNIKDKNYKLRLTTRNMVALEKALGYNPLDILFQLNRDEIPKVGDLVLILHYSLQAYQHNIKIDETYAIFDEYLEDGHSIFDFISSAITPVFREAGLLSVDDDDPN